MDSQVTTEFLLRIGFKQVKGAPKGVLQAAILRVWPEFKDRMGQAQWEIRHKRPGRSVDIESIPLDLTPQTDGQVDALMAYMNAIMQTRIKDNKRILRERRTKH